MPVLVYDLTQDSEDEHQEQESNTDVAASDDDEAGDEYEDEASN